MIWMDTVLFELTRMTWYEWIVHLVGAAGLAWLIYLYSDARRNGSPTRRRSRRHLHQLRVQNK
jgi:threonine/homoserine/homoserine lactone efflux protein